MDPQTANIKYIHLNKLYLKLKKNLILFKKAQIMNKFGHK